MNSSYLIYVIDDDELIRHYIEFSLGDVYKIKSFSNAENALQQMKKNLPHLVLLDNRLPGMSGMDALKIIKSTYPDVIVIMITGLKEVDSAVTAMKLGAYDYVLKPVNKDSLNKTIQIALQNAQLRNEILVLHEKYLQEQCPKTIGSNDLLLDIMDIVNKIAAEPYKSVLISGEKGIGKELIAQAIHARSQNYFSLMVSMNCSKIKKEYIESELFGNERDGAHSSSKIGLIEKADQGTLFINEIGYLPLNVQNKLHDFLESGAFSRYGSEKMHSVKVRIIAATSQNLKKMIQEGSFLDSLYHQLTAEIIEAPVLDKRPNDIIALAKYYLNDYKKKYHKNIIGFSIEAENGLKRRRWKQNVRELRNAVERGVIHAENQIVTLKDIFPENLTESETIQMLPPLSELATSLSDLISMVEKNYIVEALQLSNGIETKAAKMLGMTRDKFRYRRFKYGV